MAPASHIVGYSRIGAKRELKFAQEAYWNKKTSAADLEKTGKELRLALWKQLKDQGLDLIPSNTFTFYDHVLDVTCMVGALPERYGWTNGEVDLDTFFAMARGNAQQPAMEMTKWFDTNYHYIVPELAPTTKFALSSTKAIREYLEAREIGIDTLPVLVGPVTYLLLSKASKDAPKAFDRLSLLPALLKVYQEVASELQKAGAQWIQFDEPILVTDVDAPVLDALKTAYAAIGAALAGGKTQILIETYFDSVNENAFQTLVNIPEVSAVGIDLQQKPRNLETLRKHGLPAGKTLFAGVVDGRNVWANDLNASLEVLQELEAKIGKGNVVVSTSCSLLHTPVDLDEETALDAELRSWLAFAKQKVSEVVVLSDALAGNKDVQKFGDNGKVLAGRRASERVVNENVRKAVSALTENDGRRATPVKERLAAQQAVLKLPLLPTTTIGSFPQTPEIRRVRREVKSGKISEADYTTAIKAEIEKVIRLQEELGLDVLVHGEPERNDMVEYFGEQLRGFAFTLNGWVQSYGSRCVKPPIIFGDVSRPSAMTSAWSAYAQSLTSAPVKGMLTGPVTVLNWSFVRDDQPRSETCLQLALAIRDEVLDLERAGITIIQIDEAALREKLPLHRSEWQTYLDWSVGSFRITASGVKDTTQIHTHMCYSQFNDIMPAIVAMDADVISIESSRSDERLLAVFHSGGVKYPAGIGPGVYDIHSPRVPDNAEISARARKMLEVLDANQLWVNPDCGLKTRKYDEVVPALASMVTAAKEVRAELAAKSA
ncbi:methionine synthase [Klebsormidium nitens]|uniref:5-methyltetrahydropteroyltriglutamate--homocysteine S-methyltransferase n=1 Tax=Klebsormidium nitens TaxID=105231 RepID=A0A1Y1HVY6_KLENI|nr:methionine synthase [Klebsormidium nitens]|eukprot:GAQ81359.1 methionine synthase [Klebsormidium nitens]